MHVRPAPGCAVRDPFTRELLPEAGADVPETDFWLRRLLQGDVMQSPAQPADGGPSAPGLDPGVASAAGLCRVASRVSAPIGPTAELAPAAAEHT